MKVLNLMAIWAATGIIALTTGCESAEDVERRHQEAQERAKVAAERALQQQLEVNAVTEFLERFESSSFAKQYSLSSEGSYMKNVYSYDSKFYEMIIDFDLRRSQSWTAYAEDTSGKGIKPDRIDFFVDFAEYLIGRDSIPGLKRYVTDNIRNRSRRRSVEPFHVDRISIWSGEELTGSSIEIKFPMPE